MTNDNGNSAPPEPPDEQGASPEHDLLKRVLRLSHIFSSVVREILETKILNESSPLPLTVSQFHLLKLMTLNGQHQVSELADFLGVSAPAASKNIDKLERLGLVLRAPSKDDRRVIYLSASRKGQKLVGKVEAMKQARLAPVLERLPVSEVEQLTELLEKFSVTLLSREETPRGFCLRCAAYIETGCPVGHVRGGCPYDRVREGQTADV